MTGYANTPNAPTPHTSGFDVMPFTGTDLVGWLVVAAVLMAAGLLLRFYLWATR